MGWARSQRRSARRRLAAMAFSVGIEFFSHNSACVILCSDIYAYVKLNAGYRSMEPKFTPGPWEQSGRIIWRGCKSGAVICQISEPRPGPWVEHKPLSYTSADKEEAFANAHLIRAAPDLYAALFRHAGWFDPVASGHDPSCGCGGCEAHAALAKARGETT